MFKKSISSLNNDENTDDIIQNPFFKSQGVVGKSKWSLKIPELVLHLENFLTQFLFKKVKNWNQFFKPFLTNNFSVASSGADIKLFKSTGSVLSSLKTDSQKYFEYHHSAQDIFTKVNKRELELGSAAMSSLVYLVDTFGL